MPSNYAAWILEAKAHPFVVKEAPLTKPSEHEILVKNHALAVNPIDPNLQQTTWWPLNFPAILGQDVAGEVIEVGPSVTRFRPGDRVIGHALGMVSKTNEHSGFQAYTVLNTTLASHIPDEISYESAAVIPLGLSTAAVGLFQDDFLNLQYPTEPRAQPTGNALLIWGGASSVGSSAIQLAVAAGYEVYTTASPKNFEYVQNLGAKAVFDYNSATVVDDIVAALSGKKLAGALDCIGSVGSNATQLTVDVVQRADGVKFVSTTKRGFKAPADVAVKMIFGTTLKDNAVGKAVYEDFLPKALKAKTFVPAPEPWVVGKGLESVQKAVDLMDKGVSAKKIVVSL
ncbi:zinc-binding alcohol dehydrogenase family protein [Aspergillus lucknowensis]|uniref:Zinc-binding oxidoreductase CipB n=1 Tax=Aspergillus lucknowensis TaxID=176173 RepID=A0ABR4LTE2_9EURO